MNQTQQEAAMKTLKRSVIGGVTMAVALILGMGSFYVNSEYERSVITRMGEIHEVTGPGVHFKAPLIDSVHTADTRLSEIGYPAQPTATEDGQTIGVSITLNHRILNNDAAIKNLYTQFGPGFDYEERILRNMAIDRIKGVIGTYPMEEFMPNREKIRMESRAAVIDAADDYGILIEDVQLSDIQFSPKYRQRLEEVAEQRAEASKAQQLARKEGFLAEQKVAKAQGEADARRLAADAEAYSIEQKSVASAEAIQREGEAKAASLKAQASVLKNSEGLVDLTKAEAMKNWDGTFNPNVAMFGGASGGNGLLPFLNVADQIKK